MTEMPRRATTIGGRKSFKNGRPQMHTGSIVLGGQYLDVRLPPQVNMFVES